MKLSDLRIKIIGIHLEDAKFESFAIKLYKTMLINL